MNNEPIKISPLSGAVGAVLGGVDLSKSLSDEAFGVVRKALFDHGVIFFRDQKLTPEQHLDFAERWADVNVNRFFSAVEGHPKIAQVLKEPDQTENIGSTWHTDHSYDIEPALGSILYALEVPKLGGDTQFVSTYRAYDTLSSGMKALLEGMKAVHSSRHVFGAAARADGTLAGRIGNADAATQDAIHPCVIRHPGSGRASLYVNPQFTVRFDGWTDEESKPLLDFLVAHTTKPENTCRFQWAPGSVAIWDNRATWHQAINDYHGERRLMHRITVQGEPLPAFA